MQSRRHDTGQNVASDKAPETWQETQTGALRKPVERPSGERHPVLRPALKRDVREGLHIQAAEQVMHHRVAHDDHVDQRRAARDLRHHLANAAADARRQPASVAPRHGALHAAHDVASERGLRIESRPHGHHVPGRQVHPLRHHRSRPQIDGDSEAFARPESEAPLVAEHRRLPLCDLQSDVFPRPQVASQPPARFDLRAGERPPVFRTRPRVPRQQPDPASLAAAQPSARKLDTMGEQQILQRRSGGSFKGAPRGWRVIRTVSAMSAQSCLAPRISSLWVTTT